jgi:hypothetical protein
MVTRGRVLAAVLALNLAATYVCMLSLQKCTKLYTSLCRHFSIYVTLQYIFKVKEKESNKTSTH